MGVSSQLRRSWRALLRVGRSVRSAGWVVTRGGRARRGGRRGDRGVHVGDQADLGGLDLADAAAPARAGGRSRGVGAAGAHDQRSPSRGDPLGAPRGRRSATAPRAPRRRSRGRPCPTASRRAARAARRANDAAVSAQRDQLARGGTGRAGGGSAAPTRAHSSSSASACRPRAATSAPTVGAAGVQPPPARAPRRGSSAPGLQVLLPAVARDRHLHDLRGALVDRGDAHVALDLLDHVLAGVAVAAERLDAGVGGGVARLGGEVLGDRALGVEAALARRRCARPSPRCRRAPPRAARRAGRSACGCSPASRESGAARLDPRPWSTGSRGRGPPSRRRGRRPPP